MYSAPEAQEEYQPLGLDSFESSFCSRGACLGQAPWRAISAPCAAFKPAAVQAAVGADHDGLIAILRPWADAVVAAGGYPAPAPNLTVGS